MKRILSVLLTAAMVLTLFSTASFAASLSKPFSATDLLEAEEGGYPVTVLRSNYREGDGKVEKVIVPPNIKTVEEGAFANCTNLSEIELGSELQKLGKNVFSNTKYYNDENNWENGVLYIGGCLLKAKPSEIGEEYAIKDGTYLIADGAFEGCKNLKKVTIPESVRFIGTDAFNGTALYNDKANWNDDMLYIGKYLINARDVFGKVTVKDGTIAVADTAFSNAESMTEVIFPDSLRYVGEGAFFCCTGLETVAFGRATAFIGTKAFRFCNLKAISVPSDNAFFTVKDGILYDKNLTQVVRCPQQMNEFTLPDTVWAISSGAFSDCNELTRAVLPDGVRFIGNAAFADCDKLEEIELPEGLEYIDKFAFTHTHLKSISLPDSMKVLKAYAFAECPYLETAELGNGVREVERHTFFWCENLKSVSFGDYIKGIDGEAFLRTPFIDDKANYKDGMLICNDKYLIKVDNESVGTSFVVPRQIEIIADKAFEDCESIREIFLYGRISRITENTFEGTNSYADVYYRGNWSEWYNAEEIDIGDTYNLGADRRLHTEYFATLLLIFIAEIAVFAAIVIGLCVYNSKKKKGVR